MSKYLAFAALTIVSTALITPFVALSQLDVKASSNPINQGDTFKVSWSAPAAKSVLIPGYGKYASAGTANLNIKSSRTILVIAESPTEVSVKSIDVTVLGSKGDNEDFERDLDLFRYPKTTDSHLGFGDSVERITNRLADKFGFIYRFANLGKSSASIQTNHLKTPTLQVGLPKQFAARRISYLIEVKKGDRPGITQMIIRSFIERRRAIEITWYPEPDDDLYKIQTDLVAKALAE